MAQHSGTDRRSFLKAGSIVAAPFAIAAPVAALAGDERLARLARLEDERAIGSLHRAFLRRFNGAPGADCGAFLAHADAVRLDAALRSITDDPAAEAAMDFAPDGLSATARHPCRVEWEVDFTGHTTLEKMARLQGHGSHRHAERRQMHTEYVKENGEWRIARLELA